MCTRFLSEICLEAKHSLLLWRISCAAGILDAALGYLLEAPLDTATGRAGPIVGKLGPSFWAFGENVSTIYSYTCMSANMSRTNI